MVKKNSKKLKIAASSSLVSEQRLIAADAVSVRVTPNWCLLPTELLVTIFDKLDVTNKQVVASVCNVWRNAVYLPSLWQKVVALPTKSHSLLFASLEKRGIRHVSVDNLQSLKLVLRFMPQLEHLHLNMETQPSGSFLTRVFSQPRDCLKGLNLSCYIHVDDQIVATIGINFKNLKLLDLSACGQLTDATLKTVATCLKKLERLELRTCRLITDDGIGYLVTEELPLETLGLSGCKNLTDDGLRHLAWEGSKIRNLDVGYCDLLTDDGIVCLAKIPTLERLVIANLPKLTDQALAEFPKSGIVELNVGNLKLLSEVGAEYLSRMPRLQVLHAYMESLMHGNVRRGLGDTATSLSFLSLISSLRQLDLTGTRIDDGGLAHLSVTRITSLNLENCLGVSDEGMKHVAKMEYLRSLTLKCCSDLTIHGLTLLMEFGSRITFLDATGCNWSTPACLNLLAKLSFLRHLVMVRSGVTDAGLSRLVKGGSKIVSLNINQSKVTDVGLKHLSKITSLREVKLENTSVTDAGLDLLTSIGIKVQKSNDDSDESE